eukprot:Amastigsp_a177628_61.p2 type:complete len:178 gc:universal Amastigsp_a177628_61:553-20(-)
MGSIPIFNGAYEIDFSNMCQRNNNTGNSRAVRKIACDMYEGFDVLCGILESSAGQLYGHEQTCPRDPSLLRACIDAIGARIRRSEAWGNWDEDQQQHIASLEEDVRSAAIEFTNSIGGGSGEDAYGMHMRAQQSTQLNFVHVAAPWQRFGILVHETTNNGRERREKGVRWHVRDVLL